jgi:hypothetical protein
MLTSWDLMAVLCDLMAVSWDLPSGKHTKNMERSTILNG